MNAGSSVGDALTALRLQLLDGNYEPIPVVGPEAPGNSPGKRPALKEWQTIPLDADTIRGWRRSSLHNCTNTGLRTGLLLGIDIDVLQPSLAQELHALATQLLGPTPLRRIGQAPKLLLCYCAAEVIAKAMTPDFRLPDGSKAQVEILAKGQQFVAYGVHPVTRAEYEWPDAGPDVVPLADLPVVTPSAVKAFLVAAEAMIRAAGGVVAKQAGQKEPGVLKEKTARPQLPAGSTSRSGGDFFRKVNAAALASIPSWFKHLFPRGYWQANASRPPGAWRVHSADIGRALEEDISVHETEGGHDFGTRQSKTPIDLVVEHGGAPSPKDAAFLLCDWLHVTPESLGWQQPRAEQTAGSDGRRNGGFLNPSGDEPWPEPVDFLADGDLTGVPELRPEHLPDALYVFATDTAVRMGVDPVGVALAAVVACASVANDTWSIQPKALDYSWTENPRLWGAIVGDPSILKTPVIRICTHAIDILDAEARRRHDDAKLVHKAALAAWKKSDGEGEEPVPPRVDRYLVEGITTEALSEVLRDDAEAKQRAPAGKVLVRQDEMAELFANLDRYRSGGKGSGDRGVYLRLYNGGRHVLDRVGRGSIVCSNWSACLLGGIQPGPIQRIAREADDDGLLQRFLFCVPGCQVEGEDRAPDTEALHRYEALFPALVALQPPRTGASDGIPRPVMFHADAHRHREELSRLGRAMAAMPESSPRRRAALGKWPGLFARMALVFHLIDIADAHARGCEAPLLTVLSEATAGRAEAFMREVLLPHLLRAEALMFSTTQTGHARWVAGFVLSRGTARIALRDVVQAYIAFRAPETRRELLEVMESLVTMGWLRPEVPTNPARHISAWTVNPAVHSVFAERAVRERKARQKAQQEVRETIRRHRANA